MRAGALGTHGTPKTYTYATEAKPLEVRETSLGEDFLRRHLPRLEHLERLTVTEGCLPDALLGPLGAATSTASPSSGVAQYTKGMMR